MSLILPTNSGVAHGLRGIAPAFAVGVCVLLGMATTVQAGCGWHTPNILPESMGSSSHAGALVLTMYARYEAGVVTYTLQQPSEPCDGMHCRSKPSAAPVSPFLGLTRVQGTWSANSDGLHVVGPGIAPAAHGVPTSSFAHRGGLSAPEHPPRLG